MEIVYKSFDGKYFDKAEECVKHEAEGGDFTMFDKSGKLVSDKKSCYLLFVKNCTYEVEEFFEDHDFSSYVGICEGWFWWNEGTDSYVEITDLIETLERKQELSFLKLLREK